ncbi:cysteine-rich receptor-like protein kinase, partial [Trifolium medium]|nr:cysteine-rich receptor-like protein kinase [Trifolium medium]
MWKEVIRCKYGEEVVGRVEMGEDNVPWFSSLWWKDITSIGQNLDRNWFAQEVVKNLGNGRNTSFWKDKWVGVRPLKESFPRLFSISTQKQESVAGVWNGAGTAEEDKWRWSPGTNGEFSVKSTYVLVSNLLLGRDSIDREQASVFKVIWTCPAPSKVSGFSWMLLNNRIPTKDNLFQRQIIQQGDEQLCVMC